MHMSQFPMSHWSTPQQHFPLPPLLNSPWHPGVVPLPFGGQTMDKPREYSYQELRKSVCRACQQLVTSPGVLSKGGYVALHDVSKLIPTAEEKAIQLVCETEGNHANGGGSFDVTNENGTMWIRFNPGAGQPRAAPIHRAVGAPGEAGSHPPIFHSGASTAATG